MSLDIEKAVIFQEQIHLALLNLINTYIDNYDKASRSLDKLEIKLTKASCKIFAKSKEDLIRYIETSNDMHTPDIDLLQIIKETFYKVSDEDLNYYKISISVEGLREYIIKSIHFLIEKYDIRDYDKLGYEEYSFAIEIYKRYTVKKFFKQLNDRGKVSVEFNINEILRYMDIDENNTSYDKFSNLKKFKIDKMIPVIQKALGLEINVFTINLGRNTERLYLECVESINPKKYARELKEKYNIGIGQLEKTIKEANQVFCGKKKLKFKTVVDGEYLFNLGEITFRCIVDKTVNYKVDVKIQYHIKNVMYEFIINEDILNQPIIYTYNGEKSLEYILFMICNFIDEISTIMCGALIEKEIEIDIGDSAYQEVRAQLGPILNKNGNTSSCQVIEMEKYIVEEINSKSEHLIKIGINLIPPLRVDISKLLDNINENTNEYIKEYDIQDIDIIFTKGIPIVDNLIFTFNLEREESYINVANIKFIDFLDKSLKKEIEWDNGYILEEDDIFSIKNTEKEFLAFYIEKYVHDNLVAMCKNEEITKYISKELFKQLNEYYEHNNYINTKYNKKYVVNYRELIY